MAMMEDVVYGAEARHCPAGRKAYENHAQDCRIRRMGEVCETVSRKFGTGGGNVPIVMGTRGCADGR